MKREGNLRVTSVSLEEGPALVARATTELRGKSCVVISCDEDNLRVIPGLA